jgi:hypothetical protein
MLIAMALCEFFCRALFFERECQSNGRPNLRPRASYLLKTPTASESARRIRAGDEREDAGDAATSQVKSLDFSTLLEFW